MRNTFISSLVEQAKIDKDIWLLTGDLGFSVLEPFIEEFPERYINVGVAEQNMAGIAAGLAFENKVPYIYSIANFSTLRCIEHIRNGAAYHNLPLRIIAVGGGLAYGTAGYTHHAIEDLAIMRSITDLQVFSPADPYELSLVMEALKNEKFPAYIRLGKGREENLTAEAEGFTLGQARMIEDGQDICLISTGGIISETMPAAVELRKLGHSVKTISLCQLSDIDIASLIKKILPCKKIFFIEEHVGASASGYIFENGFNQLTQIQARIHRLNLLNDVKTKVGSRSYLLNECSLDSKGIINHVIEKIKS